LSSKIVILSSDLLNIPNKFIVNPHLDEIKLILIDKKNDEIEQDINKIIVLLF